MSLGALVIVAFAAYRAARAVALDDISLPLRDRLFAFAWDEEHPVELPSGEWTPAPRAAWRTWLYALFTCPLCIGFWISAAFYSAWRWLDYEAVHVVIVIFAVAGLQSLLSIYDGRSQ